MRIRACLTEHHFTHCNSFPCPLSNMVRLQRLKVRTIETDSLVQIPVLPVSMAMLSLGKLPNSFVTQCPNILSGSND